jgi:hypothetical protein
MKENQPKTQGYAGYVKAPADPMPVRVEASAFMRIGLKFAQEFAGSERGSTAIRTRRIRSFDLLQSANGMREFSRIDSSVLISSRTNGHPTIEIPFSGFDHERVLGSDVLYVSPWNEYAGKWICNSNTLGVEVDSWSLQQDIKSEDSRECYDDHAQSTVSYVFNADVGEQCDKNVTQNRIDNSARGSKVMVVCAATQKTSEFGVSHE